MTGGEVNGLALIDISHLSFAYDGSYDAIFDDVSFQLDTDWRLGFIGRNGRGKTTLLKLLTGQYEYAGTISAPVDFEYFPYAPPDPEALALAAVEAVCPEAEYWQIARELDRLEVDEEALCRPFAQLSGGERTKLLLAAMFLRENAFLLIDEPTNHLDMQGRSLVSRYLSTKKGFILVSHDRAFLDGCIDHVLSINRADITIQRGNYSTWQQSRERQDAFERAENEKLGREITRLKASAGEKSGWSDKIERGRIGESVHDRGYVGHQSARMMKRSKVIDARRSKAVEEKEKLLKNIERDGALRIAQSDYHARRLLLLRDVSVNYGGGDVCRNVSFTLEKGDRVALTGRNGCGKTSLLRLILGEDVPHSGTAEIGSGLVISYVQQDSGDLRGDLRDYAASFGIDESVFFAILRKLGFERVQFEKDMAAYSAGQKKKVMIARSLCERAHLHIWDEPMNYIDVISRAQLEELILEFQPTLLFVEHDRVFTERIATAQIELG